MLGNQHRGKEEETKEKANGATGETEGHGLHDDVDFFFFGLGARCTLILQKYRGLTGYVVWWNSCEPNSVSDQLLERSNCFSNCH